MSKTLLEVLADFATNLRYDDLSPELVSKANDCFFDFVGCYFGAVDRKGIPSLVKGIASWNASQEAPIWGFKYRTGVAEAALAMGTLGYYLEYDDGISVAGHWGSAGIPSTYLGTTQAGGSGKEFLTALVASYEVATRISRIFSPRLLSNHIHFPCTMGAFAAATGYGKGIGLDSGKLSGALSLAGLFPLGAYSTAITGAAGKSLYSGWPNYLGVNACRLADIGLVGDSGIMEHQYGFGNALGLEPVTQVQADQALAALGEIYLFMQVYFKQYPCCRWIHAPVSAVMALMSAHAFDLADIEKITVSGPRFILMYNAHEGYESKVTCQYSIPYCVAAAAFFRRLGIEEFELEARLSAGVRALAARVDVKEDNDLNGMFPASFAVNVEVLLRSGQILRRVEGTPWGPDTPPTHDELIEKFVSLTRSTIKQSHREEWVKLYRAGFHSPGAFEEAQELLQK